MKKILSVILALIIGITASVNAFAASAETTYISDVVVVNAGSEAEAKTQLEKAGYKLLSGSNLNSTLKTGVYIGYKETKNADEAITDIAAMNMKGKFSYSDYKTILKKRNDVVSSSINDILASISSFQQGYKDGTEAAKLAYNTINMYREDDSKLLMGDYLLKYDFSVSAKEDLTKVFMQGNCEIVLAIINALNISAEDEETTLIDRMVKTGTEGVANKYNTAYPTVAKAVKAMNAEYGEDAQAIYDSWDSLQQLFNNVEQNLAVDGKDDEYKTEVTETINTDGLDKETARYAADLAEVTGSIETAYSTTEAMLYENLKNTDFEDGTLLDFFMQSKDEITPTDLYFIVDSMNDAQRAQIDTVGIAQMLIRAFADTEGDDKQTKENINTYNEIVDSFEAISVYTGIDRSIFTDGVAFTSAATEHETLYGESWFDAQSMSLNLSNTDYLSVITYTSIATGFFGAVFLGMQLLRPTVMKCVYAARDKAQRLVIDSVGASASKVAQINKQANVIYSKLKVYKNCVNATRSTAYAVIKWASFVFFVIGLALDITLIVQYFTVEGITEEVIPHHIVTAVDTPYGEDYAYYQTVKDLNGKAADVNNHEGDKEIGWLVLYTTKEESAGDPILAANLKAQTGSANFKAGASFIHMFNETSALNLTADKYTGAADKANGTYILFDRESSSTLVGSAVSNGTSALIGVGGLAVGAVLGAVLAKLAGKKKKSSPSAA